MTASHFVAFAFPLSYHVCTYVHVRLAVRARCWKCVPGAGRLSKSMQWSFEVCNCLFVLFAQHSTAQHSIAQRNTMELAQLGSESNIMQSQYAWTLAHNTQSTAHAQYNTRQTSQKQQTHTYSQQQRDFSNKRHMLKVVLLPPLQPQQHGCCCKPCRVRARQAPNLLPHTLAQQEQQQQKHVHCTMVKTCRPKTQPILPKNYTRTRCVNKTKGNNERPSVEVREWRLVAHPVCE